jgi:hypothetical protein
MTRRLKQILLSMMAVGALSFVTVTGTFALMNGEQSNRGGKISSGTLTMNNLVNAGTVCFSYQGGGTSGNINPGCDALFASSSLNYPGTPAVSAVNITNSGSLDASDLSVYMPSCSVQATPGAPSPGGGDPCAVGGAQLYVQETDALGNATYCWYPDDAAGSCTFVADSLNTFAVNGNSVAAALDLGAGPAHGTTRYFKIGMQLPTNASDTLQGEEAVFALTWHMTA